VREALLVDDSENILLAIAWVTNKGVRLFRLFPEVTFWDTQQKTNRERRARVSLLAAKIQRTDASLTCGHLCPANVAGCLIGCTVRPCLCC
jgi:hypothetical protein